MKLIRTIGFAWLLGIYAVEAVVYSTGSLNQDWLNASNWGGTDPAAHPTETFIIQSGHILGPVDGSASATLWPSAGLRVERSGGILSLDKGSTDLAGQAACKMAQSNDPLK